MQYQLLRSELETPQLVATRAEKVDVMLQTVRTSSIAVRVAGVGVCTAFGELSCVPTRLPALGARAGGKPARLHVAAGGAWSRWHLQAEVPDDTLLAMLGELRSVPRPQISVMAYPARGVFLRTGTGCKGGRARIPPHPAQCRAVQRSPAAVQPAMSQPCRPVRPEARA